MKCPACEDSTLETYTSAVGSFERCPRCEGLFIHRDLIAAASQDRAKCLEALGETEALLLPTDRWCPKCLQKLADGRIRSRGLICTLCPSCQAFWTNLSSLNQLEESIGTAIRLQMDAAGTPTMGLGALPGRVPSYYPSAYPSAGPLEPVQDAGLGRFFRAFARLFDRWADAFSGNAGLAAKPRVKPGKATKPVKKPLIAEVQPAAPAPIVPKEKRKEPEPLPEAPLIEIPEFVFPEETQIEEKAPEPPAPEPKREPIPELKPEPIPEPKPELKPKPKPETKPEQKPEPIPESKPEPKPEPPPEPAPPREPEPKIEPKLEPDLPKRGTEAEELLRLMEEESPPPVQAPEQKPPEPKPVAPMPATPKPVPLKPKPLPQPSSSRSGFFAKFKAAWSPAPKKAVKPPLTVKLPETPTPAPTPKPVPSVKPVVKSPKPAGEGFFAKLFAPKKPLKKPTIQSPLPVSSLAPAPTPAPAPAPSPAPVKAPAVKPPAPVVKKPAPAPKPKKEKVPSSIDHLAVWPPWALALLAVICSAFRDFGFEPMPAALWGLAGWSIGFMVRLVRLYPFRPFEETDLTILSVVKGRVSPVILKGQIVPADELKPKGEVVFKQGEKSIRLNPLGLWDIIPRLFGLSNPRQLLQGDVTVRGWYRHGIPPVLEVQEVRSEKAVRKSMVKMLRWASAVSLLALALLVSLALE